MSIYRGFHKLDDLVFTLNKPLIGKKGVHFQKLLKDWSLIVGDDIARYAIPIKISTSRSKETVKNILHIATNNSASGAELVYHLGIIQEQLNFYFGYEYISHIKLTQAVFQVTDKIDTKETKALSLEQKTKLGKLIENYSNEDEIKKILTNLAADLVSRT